MYAGHDVYGVFYCHKKEKKLLCYERNYSSSILQIKANCIKHNTSITRINTEADDCDKTTIGGEQCKYQLHELRQDKTILVLTEDTYLLLLWG